MCVCSNEPVWGLNLHSIIRWSLLVQHYIIIEMKFSKIPNLPYTIVYTYYVFFLTPGKCTIPQSIVCNDGIQVHTTKSEFADIGDVVQYRVPSGYGLIGDPPICQPDSTWSAPPKCLSKWKEF